MFMGKNRPSVTNWVSKLQFGTEIGTLGCRNVCVRVCVCVEQ